MWFTTSLLSIIFVMVQKSLMISFSQEDYEDNDIKKFLNTTEPIWTYNTTAAKRRFCEVVVMYNLTNELILFNRSYFRRKKKTVITKEMMGKFSEEFNDEMSVGFKDVVVVTLEQLFYVNENGTCGIFMVIPEYNGIYPYYDLRVKNSSITTGPDANCTKEFSLIGPTGRLAYEADCQKEVFPRNDTS
ncbi:uncharacterized protein [Dermacentor andersoni]|uniref:uncharacterized protein n=1 Tax=Dermacentor andersoni TaxID=34620 RepID=UPI00215566E6|nr:uncharacterized protein LOC126534060 [Dermacentor andersoni]